jgi:hypoxanthine phosphoribosyltransferase
MKGNLKLLYDKKQINNAVDKIAEEISNDKHLAKDLVVLCVLKGAFIFCADLVRLLPMIPTIDFIRITKINNKVKWLIKPSVELEGKSVLVVDDIFDSGDTVRFLRKALKKYKPSELKIAALLKKSKDNFYVNEWPDYTGFLHCPNNKFIIGYGLDSEDKMRHLPQLYYIDK